MIIHYIINPINSRHWRSNFLVPTSELKNEIHHAGQTCSHNSLNKRAIVYGPESNSSTQSLMPTSIWWFYEPLVLMVLMVLLVLISFMVLMVL